MMSKERRTLLITTFICLCSLLVYISFTAVYPEPKTVQQNLYSNMLFVGGIVINVVLNIVLNFKVCKTMGAKFLVKLGKSIFKQKKRFRTNPKSSKYYLFIKAVTLLLRALPSAVSLEAIG